MWQKPADECFFKRAPLFFSRTACFCSGEGFVAIDSISTVIYAEIDCSCVRGWFVRFELAAFSRAPCDAMPTWGSRFFLFDQSTAASGLRPPGDQATRALIGWTLWGTLIEYPLNESLI
jgi:hypothetical protein